MVASSQEAQGPAGVASLGGASSAFWSSWWLYLRKGCFCSGSGLRCAGLEAAVLEAVLPGSDLSSRYHRLVSLREEESIQAVGRIQCGGELRTHLLGMSKLKTPQSVTKCCGSPTGWSAVLGCV